MGWTSGRDGYNKTKRDIKTVVLRGLSKIKGRSTRGKIRPVEGPTRVFVEIGTGQRAEWTYLIREDWQDIARSKRRTDRLRALPESWLSEPGDWHGYLVEAHPRNFSALVEKTVAAEKLRPFLHHLTFSNAARKQVKRSLDPYWRNTAIRWMPKTLRNSEVV